MPEFTTPSGVTVRVIAGTTYTPNGTPVPGAVQRADTEPLYLDLHLPGGKAEFSLPVPRGHNAFLYVYRGTLQVLDDTGEVTRVPGQRMAILGNSGDGIALRADPASHRAHRARC